MLVTIRKVRVNDIGRGFLAGTNVYMIGTGKKRFMIDACIMNNLKYLENV